MSRIFTAVINIFLAWEIHEYGIQWLLQKLMLYNQGAMGVGVEKGYLPWHVQTKTLQWLAHNILLLYNTYFEKQYLQTTKLTLFLSGWGLYDPTVRKILITNLLFASETPLFVTFPKTIFLIAN